MNQENTLRMQDMLDRFRAKYDENPEAFEDLNGTYQLDMRADGGNVLHLLVLDGLVDLREGELAAPDYVLTITSQDFNRMLAGQLNPAMAYMSGKLRLTGKPDMFEKIAKLMG